MITPRHNARMHRKTAIQKILEFIAVLIAMLLVCFLMAEPY